MLFSNPDFFDKKNTPKKNEPYEKICSKCGNIIIMNHSSQSGKWYAVNILDGSYHQCGLKKKT